MSVAAVIPARMGSTRFPGKPLARISDKPMIQRMIANLIDNAVKYTPPGGRVDVSTDIGPDGGAVLSVKDTGMGISAENLERIFDRFFRCDLSRSTSGAGLGLSLVKAVAEAHKGGVEVRSTIDVGSCFTVTLPKENKNVP